MTEVQAETHPDLAVGSPSVSDSSPTSGATFSLSAAVRNDGDGTAAATTLHYYRSTDATITTADTSVGTDAVGGLAAAAASSASIDLTAPSAPGTYYYGACVDAVTGESDTTNNCSSAVSVTVSAPPPPLPSGPDLTVHGIVTVTSLDGTPPGGSFQLGASVENQGDEPLGSHDLALLPVDGRHDHALRHRGGHGHRRGAIRWSDHPHRDLCHRAGVSGHVLLRRVRGRGDGGIRHD